MSWTAEEPELVVGRLGEVGAPDLLEPGERTDRGVLERQLGVLREPGEHRLPVPRPDAVVERAHVPLDELPTCLAETSLVAATVVPGRLGSHG